MNITHITFSYPSDAKYLRGIPELIELFEREGGPIEDYSNVLEALREGDRILHDGLLWTVAEIQPYTAQGHEHSFSVAIATLDGAKPATEPDSDDQSHLHVHFFEGKALMWGAAQKRDYLPKTGDSPRQFPEHEISQFWDFEPERSYRGGFESVRVCECVPAAVEVEPEAIAA